MTQEAKCENTGGVNFLLEHHVKTNLYVNSQESSSPPFTNHHAVGLDGTTTLTTSTTNKPTKMTSQ